MPKTSWQSSSRMRAQRAIINTTMLLFLITLATITHASTNDGCRGNCDQFRDRFCYEWIGTCEQCSISTENAKCVAYFKSLEVPNYERPPSPSTWRAPSTEAPPSVAASSAQPIRPSSDELTNEDGPNPSQDQADQSNTQSKNPVKPKDSEETRSKSHEVPDDRDSDGAAGGGGESSGSPFTLAIGLALFGSLVVMVTGGFVIRRRQRNTSRPLTAATVEGQQQEEENQALTPTQACQEEGIPGGTLALPNADLYVQNEAHGHGDFKETEL